LAKEETPEIVSDAIKNSTVNNEITDKSVGFYNDKVNTNFGGSLHLGKSHIITELSGRMKRVIFATRCGKHIVHICVQSRCDTLSVVAEALVMKIH
jgi:hypothetical protein